MNRSLILSAVCVALFSCVSACSEQAPAAIDPPLPTARVEHESAVALTTTARTSPTPTAHVTEPTPAPVMPRVTRTTDGELSLRRLVVATGIEGHEPVGASDVVDADEAQVYAFLDVANPGDAETLVVTFASDDGERVVGHVEVSVPAGAPRWRTWAFTRHLSPGDWHAEVHTIDGRLIDAHAFEVR